MTNNLVSECCGAPVKTEGLPDFPSDDCMCTWYYVCTKCDRACDAVEDNKDDKQC